MRIEEFEIFLEGSLKTLPRRRVVSGRKELVWSKIHNHILETKLASLENKPPGSFWNVVLLRRNLARALVTTVLVIIAVTLVRGAADATPGEALYPVKKAAEKFEVVLASGPEAKLKIQVKHAKRRLEEVKILVEENKETQIVTQTLKDLKTTTQEVVASSEAKPELVNQAVELAAHQEQVLSTVQESAGNEIKVAVQEVINETRDSINKLTTSNEEEIPTEELSATNASSTFEEIVEGASAVAKPKKTLNLNPPVLESPVQIHEIIQSVEEPAEDANDDKIILNPDLGF